MSAVFNKAAAAVVIAALPIECNQCKALSIYCCVQEGATKQHASVFESANVTFVQVTIGGAGFACSNTAPTDGKTSVMGRTLGGSSSADNPKYYG